MCLFCWKHHSGEGKNKKNTQICFETLLNLFHSLWECENANGTATKPKMLFKLPKKTSLSSSTYDQHHSFIQCDSNPFNFVSVLDATKGEHNNNRRKQIVWILAVSLWHSHQLDLSTALLVYIRSYSCVPSHTKIIIHMHRLLGITKLLLLHLCFFIFIIKVSSYIIRYVFSWHDGLASILRRATRRYTNICALRHACVCVWCAYAHRI